MAPPPIRRAALLGATAIAAVWMAGPEGRAGELKNPGAAAALALTPKLSHETATTMGTGDFLQFAQIRRRSEVPDVTRRSDGSEPLAEPLEQPADPEAEAAPPPQDGRRRIVVGAPDEGEAPVLGEGVAPTNRFNRAPDPAPAIQQGAPLTVPADPADIVSRPGAETLLSDVEPFDRGSGLGRRLSDPERRAPGDGAFVPEPEPYVDPRSIPAPPPRAAGPDDFLAIPDRWRLVDTLGLVEENWLDPYNQNTLKGDKPIYKGHCLPPLKYVLGESASDCFVVLLGISDTVVEPRSFPTPIGVQTSNRANRSNLFGEPDQVLINQNFIHGFSFINGNTAFRPQDIEFRYTGVLNFNYVDVEELRVLRVDPTKGGGDNRFDGHYGVQEAFIDYHIADITDRYDFYSARVGVQPFSSDFRGFLFQDLQLGARFFGNYDNNLWQYNLGWFRRLEKDTNSGLNDVSQKLREDDVFLANVYRQDFPILGMVSQGTVLYNRNREGSEGRYFDDNGFLARPASIGNQRGRDYDVVYLGYNADGRIGRLNLTGSAYYAFGEDDNQFTDRKADISAYFGAVEASYDLDWLRLRGSALYASGDDDPFDDTQGGFDAIFENPQFAGGDTSYWIRQQIPLIGGGGVGLSSRNAVLPALRHSKEHGQSNFVNPGITLIGAGFDADLTPEFRLSGNANYMWFNDTSSLETLRQQGSISRDIGLDLSVAAIYRPFFHQNIVFRLSAAALLPGEGFNDLYGSQNEDDLYYSVLGNLVLTY